MMLVVLFEAEFDRVEVCRARYACKLVNDNCKEIDQVVLEKYRHYSDTVLYQLGHSLANFVQVAKISQKRVNQR